MKTPYKIFIACGCDNIALDDATALWQSLDVEVVTPLHIGTTFPSRQAIHNDIQRMLDCDGVHFMDGWELATIPRLLYNMAVEFGLDIYPPANPIVDVDSFQAINNVARRCDINAVLKICQAINQALGVTFLEICGNRRFRNQYFARMALVHECLTFMDEISVCRLMGITRPALRYFKRMYIHETQNNRKYSNLMAEIQGWNGQ